MAPRDTVWLDLLDVGFEQRFYDVGGIRTRCIEAGEGPPIVFLHGGGGHAETWVRNLGPHSPHRRCYAIDMLGHGHTDAPADAGYTTDEVIDHVVRFLDIAGIDRADFCGESFGGRVSAWMAIRHPDRVGKLVLNTSGGLPATGDRHQVDVQDLLARTTASLEAGTEEAVRSRMEWLFADPGRVPDEFIAIRQAIYRRPGIKNSLTTLFSRLFDPADAKRYWLTPERLAGIDAPALVIWSDHNPIHSWQDAREGFSHIPDVRFHLVKDAAHWPQWEQPDEYNTVQVDFLRGIESANEGAA
ncbi:MULTISPECIES: alpha/beta fold hydrolase [Pseudonocardia]|uniref:2-hydroxymuconate semialdehyde hydrolase n=2 Tax=Pseudonocardia TaxID=1847 RepID=A0A1Y2N1N2_PSEAH|nr:MULTISPECIES: alpha/beta fold hydrolase [Pseudonocardia]OSY40798.1 2-hydroxymuconate semialdehyde hydrolase [Pseudonocardia autotrophica]TDN71895.1 2-hydroxy-6-oxonona-2,4-dienedioate hydrolase [Pseudonocardia autotrophica]BBG02583.1 2-hydroxy-6-ketonona-2,4-dienedioic acid hydrolase [Pseudonocardia autotrophica]GEC24642.1 2-hydroxy-6-ketonona-2,4-dienedioic acid hydrolase [Pseudonocardia saturnea]